MKEEVWKPSKILEGKYLVSNLGNIRHVDSNQNRKPNKNKLWGYLSVTVRLNKKLKTFRIHRLIAFEFLNNDNNLTDVNHKNGDRTDNRVDNLEWLSHSDNVQHSFTVLKRTPTKVPKGENHWNYKFTDEQIKTIRELVKLGIEEKDILSMYDISKSYLYNITKGKERK